MWCSYRLVTILSALFVALHMNDHSLYLKQSNLRQEMTQREWNNHTLSYMYSGKALDKIRSSIPQMICEILLLFISRLPIYYEVSNRER